MRSYHITITMADGSQGEHCGLYPDGAAAGVRAIELFPNAHKIDVFRLSTVLLRSPGARSQRRVAAKRSAA